LFALMVAETIGTVVVIERKTKIKTIHNGYKFQIYAQMFALEEAGHPVDKMFLHSLEDNKRYAVEKPNADEIKRFEETLEKMRCYDVNQKNEASQFRCDLSIYRHLSY